MCHAHLKRSAEVPAPATASAVRRCPTVPSEGSHCCVLRWKLIAVTYLYRFLRLLPAKAFARDDPQNAEPGGTAHLPAGCQALSSLQDQHRGSRCRQGRPDSRLQPHALQRVIYKQKKGCRNAVCC